MEDRGGQTLKGRFDLVESVGQGAMGTVWRALDRQTSQTVAVKLLKTQSPSATASFLREIEALGELRHPHIVAYVDHGLAETGEPYLAMEWLAGCDLQSYLLKQQLTSDQALCLASQVLSALHVAHGRGIVHRDLKPANIFLCDGSPERIKVLDFGVVKRLFDAPAGGQRLAIGTPLYMSPEQARGLPDIDGRSDLFSLGSVLYEAVFGTAPFFGETSMAVLAKVCVDEPTPLEKIFPRASARLCSLVGSLLIKARAHRSSSAASALASLREVTSHPADLQANDSLSLDEQRVVAVIMSRRERGSSHASSSLGVASLPKHVQEGVTALGFAVNQLIDGTLLLTCSGKATAPELAAKAARCSLTLRRHWPTSSTAISLGKTVVRQGLPFGKLVDETSHRLASTGAGEISTDEETAGLMSRTFAVRSHRDGWLLLDDAFATPLPVSTQAERTFVGRRDELATLLQKFACSVERNQLEIAVYTGPPGVGKSRMAAEFLSTVRQRKERFAVWQAQGDALQTASPLRFVRQLAMSAFQVQEDTPRRNRRDLVERFFTKQGHQHEGSSVYLAELVGATPTGDSENALKSARSDPRFMAEQMALAFGDMIRAASTNHPVVLLLDDIQWADQASVKLLNSAFQSAGDQSCFAIGLARPELNNIHPEIWRDRSIHKCNLEPLNRFESEQLLSQVLSTDRAETAAWVAERAEGNPFFIEELARTLKRRGKTQIPDAVLGTVQARLDDLPASARRVLRAASIFGRTFHRDGLLPLLGSEDQNTLEHWLNLLAEEQILGDSAASTLVFKHDLIREATYQSLTDGDRVLGHRLAGQWLEEQGTSPVAVLLEHFSRACDWPKSCVLAQEAADHAYSAGDLEGAICFCQKAIAYNPEPAQAGTARLTEATCYRWLGRMQQAWEPAQLAMKLLPKGSAAWFKAIDCSAGILGERINHNDVLALANKARRAIPQDAEAFNERCIALADLAGCLIDAGMLDDGRALAFEAGNAGANVLRHETTNQILNAQAKVERRQGQLGLARRSNEAALAEAIKAENTLLQANSRNNLSALLLEVGMLEQARVHLEQSLVFARKIRSKFFEGITLANLGQSLLFDGRLSEADSALEQAASCIEGQGLAWIELGVGLYRAHLAIMRRRPEAAMPFIAPFLQNTSLVPPYRSYALGLASQMALFENDVAKALSLADEGCRLIDDLSVLPEEGEMYVRLALAEALLAARDTDAAHRVLLRATAALEVKIREMSDPEMEAAFLKLSTHRRLFELLNAMETERTRGDNVDDVGQASHIQ